MKFLLFFVSLIFSLIFYIFHNLSIWKDFFWKKIEIDPNLNLVSFSSNILIESFVFLLIWVIFLYFFSNLKNKWSAKLEWHKIEIFYFLFYIVFLFYIYFYNNSFDYSLLIIVILFLISDILFNHISNILSLSKYKKNLRYFWLVLNYICSVFSVYYIFSTDNNHFIAVLILIYSISFNVLLHKKYTNYISLFLSILIILFLIYNLSFFLFELYI
jgi:hypothetical protein